MNQQYQISLYIKVGEQQLNKMITYPIDDSLLDRELEEIKRNFKRDIEGFTEIDIYSDKELFVEVKDVGEFPICYDECIEPHYLNYIIERFIDMTPIKRDRLTHLNNIRPYLSFEDSLIIVECNEYYKIATDKDKSYIYASDSKEHRIYLGFYHYS